MGAIGYTSGDPEKVDVAGDVMTGALSVNTTEAVDPPAVIGASDTGINVLSSFEGGEDEGQAGQFDSTGRLNLYSYQRADVRSYGENIRHFMMRGNAKSMDAWYFPDEGYDGSLEPVGSFKPVVWTGAHWQANDGLSNHKHWSVETPDSTGAIQTRFEIRFGDTAVDNAISGLDKTLIATNLTDFVVRCSNGQEFRLAASAGTEKAIMFSNDSEGAAEFRRWKVRATGEAETGSDAGTNFQIARYDDAGTFVDAPVHIDRATGDVAIGGVTSPQHDLHVNGDTYVDGTLGVGVEPDGATSAKLHRTSGGTVLAVTNGDATTLAGLITVNGANDTRRAFQAGVSGDTVSRFSVETSGLVQWGPGAASARDTNLYRSAANTLKTDDNLHVALSFQHLGNTAGFFGATPAAKPTVTGSRTDGTALASLLTALATLGLITDSSTA